MTAAVVELDPRKLAQHPANIRRAKGDLTGLVASVRQLGILQPIVVEQLPDGGHQVLAGHRRLAAALKAGLELVPVRVVDLKDNPSALAMLAENQQRKDLTVAEEAAAYLQLEADGMEVEEIARQTGVDRHRVEGSIKAAASKKAAAASHKHDLTLEQTLVLAEFDGDAKAVKKLTDVAIKNPGQFDHTAGLLRAEAKEQAAMAKITAAVKAKGLRLCTKHVSWYGTLDDPTYIEDLAGEKKGTKLSEADHKDCPGHAVVIVRDGYGSTSPLKAKPVCEEPRKYGHKKFRSSTAPTADQMSPAEREKASAERREVIANNKAWGPATEVRTAFVKALLKRKAPPKGTLRYAVEAIAGGAIKIDSHGALEDLVGVKGPKVGYWARPALGLAQKGSDAALPMALLALVCASIESELAQSTWRRTEPHTKRYLEFLVSAGYELAPVEELITKGGRR